MLFSTENAMGLVSLMSFLICCYEFTMQLNIIFIGVEKVKL